MNRFNSLPACADRKTTNQKVGSLLARAALVTLLSSCHVTISPQTAAETVPAAGTQPAAPISPGVAQEQTVAPVATTAASDMVSFDGEMTCAPHKPTAKPVEAICIPAFIDEESGMYYQLDSPKISQPAQPAAAPAPKYNQGDTIHIDGHLLPPPHSEWQFAGTILVTQQIGEGQLTSPVAPAVPPAS